MASNLLKGKHILTVDDEQDMVDILREELDEHGVEFDSASALNRYR